MPSIIVYGGRMGSSFRAHWALAEAGLSYETKTLDFAKGEHRGAEFLAVNPAGQIPAMVYDGMVLSESMAIAYFIAEKHKPELLGPNTAESHAQMIRWQMFSMLNLNTHFTSLAAKAWGNPPSPEVEAKANEGLARFLPVFEGWMKDKQFVAGADFTVADIVIRSTFAYADLAVYDLKPYPAIVAWMARCAERPAFTAAMKG